MDSFRYALYREGKRIYEDRARILGIAALAAAFLMTTFPFLALVLGGFAVLFALLSKGYNETLSRVARTGFWTGLGAIVISLSLIFSTVFALKINKEYRDNVTEMAETLFGDFYEESYGISVTEVMSELFGEGSN